MTAPSRMNVNGDTLSVYWRDEASARHAYDTVRIVGDHRITGHELMTFAPATDRSMPGFHAPLVPGVGIESYKSIFRAAGAGNDAVVAFEPHLANAINNLPFLHAQNVLGNVGVNGDGQNLLAGSHVSTTVTTNPTLPLDTLARV